VGKLRVEEIQGTEALQALRDQWQALFSAAQAVPFLSWEWMITWQEWFGQERTPRLVCAREGESLVGLLPLCEQGRRLGPFTLRCLSFLGEEYVGADYLDVLALPGREQEAATEIFKHLAQSASFDLLSLEGLAASSPSLPILVWQFGTDARFEYQLTPRDLCPQVRIAGRWEEVVKQSRRPHSFNKLIRRLRKIAGFDYRVITTAEEASAAFERFLSLHEQAWQAQGGSDAMGHPALRGFHRALVLRMARAGLLRFEELWIEGACRASNYAFSSGRSYYLYQGGYDPGWAKQSVGLALDGLSLADAVDRGVSVCDFLRGTETYKFTWANETHHTVTVRVANHRLPVKLLLASEQLTVAARLAARAILQAVCSEQVMKKLRQLCRARNRKQKFNPVAYRPLTSEAVLDRALEPATTLPSLPPTLSDEARS
jgi:CelD/BcsL family acetyltransferase involved in cellulose biosynthesis